MSIAKKIFLALWIALLGVAHVAVLSPSGNHVGNLFSMGYDSERGSNPGYDGSQDPFWRYDGAPVHNAGDRERAVFGNRSHSADFAKSVAADTTPNLLYHYTTAPESSFANGLWEGTSVTDKLYTDPLQASQELGIPVPNKVIPVQNAGQFIPNKPPIVQPSFRYPGGGTDFINPQPVPPSQLLPAQPFGGG